MIAHALIQHIFTRAKQIGEMGYGRHISVGVMTNPLSKALNVALEKSNKEFFPPHWGHVRPAYGTHIDLGIGKLHMYIEVEAFLTGRDDIDVSASFKLDEAGNLINIAAEQSGLP